MPFPGSPDSIDIHLVQQLEGVFFRRTIGNDSRFKFISENLDALLGYTIDELNNSEHFFFNNLIHPDDSASYNNYLKQLNHLHSNKIDYRIILKDGSIKWLREFAILIPERDNIPAYHEGFMQDVSIEKENILLSRAFNSYQIALNQGSLVSITDLTGKLLFVNDLFCTQSGFSREELIGKTHHVLNSGYHNNNYFKQLWETILAGNVWHGEIKNKSKDGNFFWVDMVISPVFGENNELIQFLAIHKPITEVKNLERRINDISKSSSSVVFQLNYTNNKFEFNFLSQSAKQILQQTPEQFYNNFKTFEKLLHQPDLKGFKLRLEESIISLEDWLHQFRINIDGQISWINVRAIPEKLENDTVIWNGVMTDISSLKETEEELSSLASQLNHIYEIQKDCFWGSDIKHKKMLYTSPGSQTIYGCSPQEFMTNPNLWFELIIPEDQPKFGQLYAALGKGETVHIEFRINHPKTGIKWLECRMTGTLDKENKLVRIDGITTDIHQRKISEINLLRRERMLAEAQRISQIGSWEYYIDEEIATYSDEIKRIYGFSTEELVEPNFKDFADRIDPAVADQVKKEFFSSIKNGLPFRSEHKIILRNGLVKQVVQQCEIEFDKFGKPYKALGTTRDITADKEIANKMEQLISELTSKNEELDRIVYSTSHDLRAPLLSVLGLIDILEENMAQNPENLEIASYIRKSIIRSDDTIKGIVDYSRNSRLDPVYESLDVKTMIEQTIDNIKFMEHSQDVKFEMVYSFKSKFVSDKERFQTVLNNLITNAVKYQRPDATQKHVKISFSYTRNQGVLTVEDNGEGIPEDRQVDVFGMFVRNSVLSTGSGIGLYLCKEIVAKLGGEIYLSSKPAKGSRFTITLPNQAKNITG